MSMNMMFNEKPKKSFSVRVTTMDADLEFKIEGVKKPIESGVFHFHFLVKFYPENVEEELIQDVTRHLFFLQIKQAILTMELYCPPEASVLLASYAVQAKFGDYDASVVKPLLSEELLPQRVIDQYQMTPEMWEERIQTWWMNNKGLSREDAELEYLKIAQDLDMYGIHYFQIRGKKESDLWLGVIAYGINIYENDNRLVPKAHFTWNDIKNISFKDKELIVKLVESPSSRSFWLQNIAVNRIVLDLCVGTHNLYLIRRQADSLEMQQMKIQAKEERLRRQAEHNKLEHERVLREGAEREREELREERDQLKKQLLIATDAMKRTEETAELLAEKAKISEEEALVLTQRASEAEAEIQRIKISSIKIEEQKIMMERKAREAELIAGQLLEEAEHRAKDSEKLEKDLIRMRQSERLARERLSEVAVANSYVPLQMTYSQMGRGLYEGEGGMGFQTGYPPDPLVSRGVGHDIKYLHAEIEKERVEYVEKSKHLQEQLSELRTEIEGLKLEDRQTEHDKIHHENLRRGQTKYSTLQKSGAASSAQKAKMLENL